MPSPAKTPRRRTQTERSDAMRERLLRATLDCLARDGYSGTTLSSIVRRAGVSRGAQVHHYPSKDALILDAAAHLMRRAYRVLGEMLLGIASEEDRLQALLNATWSEIFDTQMFRAFFELLLASHRDKALAKQLRALNASVVSTVSNPIDHYFEKRSAGSEPAQDMFQLTVMLFGGMAAIAHLAPDAKLSLRQLDLWGRLMSGQMRARKGVKTPPPRPPRWTREADLPRA